MHTLGIPPIIPRATMLPLLSADELDADPEAIHQRMHDLLQAFGIVRLNSFPEKSVPEWRIGCVMGTNIIVFADREAAYLFLTFCTCRRQPSWFLSPACLWQPLELT